LTIEFAQPQLTTYGRQVEPEPAKYRSKAWLAWNHRKWARWHRILHEVKDRALFSFLSIRADGFTERNYVARYGPDDWRAVSFRGTKPWGYYGDRNTLHACLDNIFAALINDDGHWKDHPEGERKRVKILDDKSCPAHPWVLWHQSERAGETVCLWHGDEGTNLWWCLRCRQRYLSTGGACEKCDSEP
jgi:hypothetical protein